MILLVTNRRDVTTDFVVVALRARGSRFVRLNTEDLLTDWRITWSTSGWRARNLSGRMLESGEVTGIYYRRPRTPVPVDGTASEAGTFVMRESAALLRGLYAHTTGCWISDPSCIEAAEDKLRQLRVAEQLGFDIPRTLVTNEPDRAKLFVGAVRNAVVKPLSSGHLSESPALLAYTAAVGADDDFEAVTLAPHLFQERIEKTADVRVTVVDDRVFACRIASQSDPRTALDWRTATALGIQLEHEIIVLPAELETLCVSIVRQLGLRFGAIDLIEHTSGHTFLEINPNGQWAWIEQRTGANISGELAEALTVGRTRAA
jgi:glutathione synthase/RimK-type ligase-like ATP-grasp enzyme